MQIPLPPCPAMGWGLGGSTPSLLGSPTLLMSGAAHQQQGWHVSTMAVVHPWHIAMRPNRPPPTSQVLIFIFICLSAPASLSVIQQMMLQHCCLAILTRHLMLTGLESPLDSCPCMSVCVCACVCMCLHLSASASLSVIQRLILSTLLACIVDQRSHADI